MKLIIWFARNPVAANFLMLLIIAGGLLGLTISKRHTVPPAPQNQLQIEINYPGAGPAEVEQALCIPIEEAIHELEGIRHIKHSARLSLNLIPQSVRHDSRLLCRAGWIALRLFRKKLRN